MDSINSEQEHQQHNCQNEQTSPKVSVAFKFSITVFQLTPVPCKFHILLVVTSRYR